MGPDGSDTNTDLESFREQWRAEVRSKRPEQISGSRPGQAGPSTAVTRPARREPPKALTTTFEKDSPEGNDQDYAVGVAFDEPHDETLEKNKSPALMANEPVSALEHYEQAVEKEAQGALGKSLSLYRTAFRMDSMVERKYKNAHFPPSGQSKTTQSQPSAAHSDSGSASQVSAPVSGNEAHKAAATAPEKSPQSLKDLIMSFMELSIEPAPPPVEGMPQPPCPIAELPEEILYHILRDVALDDVGDFVRLAQVCKRLAYIVLTEDRIWRRVCVGLEFGFGGMHYQWNKAVTWSALDEDQTSAGPEAIMPESRVLQQERDALITTNALFGTVYNSSWQRMFRQRPRIRFNGCYISTVNYFRSGMATSYQATWASPVYIVTYFRYLRFFRDGTVISLLTTAEPANVVHHLNKEQVELRRKASASYLPSAVVDGARRGRWRLSSAADKPEAPLSETEGDLVVETEGVGKYLYRLDLSLRNAGKGARNNKLAWRGHYSYDALTDDWAEFSLKNDKAYIFSRVKSYGVGITEA